MPDLADIADECIHGLTTAWCSMCKAKTRAAEARRREARRRAAASWKTERTLPYPRSTAGYVTRCPICDEDIVIDSAIYKVDGYWVCEPCATDQAILDEKGS